jgi:2-dehydro-3-deoxyglucarate aldolase/4-hydroxy-2-oxoheptanedioate aldolase
MTTKSTFRNRLLARERLLGTVVTLSNPAVSEILAEAGFDWLWIDLEHSPMDPSEAQGILQAVANRAECVVRVPLNDEIWIKRCLDSGADGLIIPQVSTPEDARRAVRWCKYPPQGTRSVGASRAQGYGASLQEYLDRANQETAVVVQIETAAAVSNIQAILEVEGVDGFVIGPFDLSASLGFPGQIDHPEVLAAIESVRAAVLEHGRALGIFTGASARVRGYFEQGFTLVAASTDTLLLNQAARELCRLVKDKG